MVGGRTGWTVLRFTYTGRQTGPPAGKRGMVRAGGTASRTISDSNTPDPGWGHHPTWKRPRDDTHGPRWTPDAHGFPSLGSLTPAEKDRRDRAVPDRAPAMVDTNSHLDPLGRPEGDGSHQAPLGHFVKTYRRRTASVGRGGGIGTGAGTEITIWTEDQVKRSRRSRAVGSCRAPPPLR